MSEELYPPENEAMAETRQDQAPLVYEPAYTGAAPPVSGPAGQAYPFAQPMTVPAPKIKKGVPGITGFGFTSALLSLFLLPFYKEAFENYLLYDGVQAILLHYYYYATIALGSLGILFALFGLVLTPVGIHMSKRRENNGRALGVSGLLIALVALILYAAVTVAHVTLYSWLFPR